MPTTMTSERKELSQSTLEESKGVPMQHSSPASSQGRSTTEKDDSEVDDNTPDYVTGYKLLFAMSALTLCAILINLDSSILSTATPTITDEFHSVKDIGWYISSYQLALSALQPLTGKLFTYFSNKWTYIVFFVVFEIGSLVCGLATSSSMFIAGRAVSGIGASGVFNGLMIIIYGMVPAPKRPSMTGAVLAVCQVGIIAGPLIGGSLTQYTTWRWCFWINLPIGAVACILLALVYIPDHVTKPSFHEILKERGIHQTFDVTGSVLLVSAVIQLLLALQFGGSEYQWNSAVVIGLFCGSGASMTLFMAWEYRAKENALIPTRMLLNRVVACGSLMNLCLYGLTFITTFFIPIYFQSILGDSPMKSGIHMLPSIVSSILFTLLSGMLVSKLGYYLPWAVFAAMLMTVGSGLMSTWSTTTSVGMWVGYQVIFGVGRGLVMQMGIVAIQTVVPPAQVATALTIVMFIQGISAAILVSVGNTIFDSVIATQIRSLAPNVDPKVVIAAGATAFRTQVPPQDLANVVQAWVVGFQQTMYIATGLSAGVFVFSWGLGLYDVRKKDEHYMAQGPVEEGKA